MSSQICPLTAKLRSLRPWVSPGTSGFCLWCCDFQTESPGTLEIRPEIWRCPGHVRGLSDQSADRLALATSGFLGTWAAYKYWVPSCRSQPSRNRGCPGSWERAGHLHQTLWRLPDSLEMRGTQAIAWHEPCGVDCVQVPRVWPPWNLGSFATRPQPSLCGGRHTQVLVNLDTLWPGRGPRRWPAT